MATQVFERAKASLERYLQDHIRQVRNSSIRAMAKPVLIARLDQMIREVRDADLDYSYSLDFLASPNAGARNSTVINGGLMLYADRAPETLFMIYLHELMHIASDTDLPPDLRHPFAKHLTCLRGADSIRIQPADPACFRSLASRELNARYAERYRWTAEKLEENPWATWGADLVYTDSPSDWCQVSQQEEALAALGSTDAYFGFAISPVSAADSSARRTAGGRNQIDVRTQLLRAPAVASAISHECSNYWEENHLNPQKYASDLPASHPDVADELSGIMLAHPRFKTEILGCPASYVARRGSRDARPTVKRYCGDG